MLKNYKFLPVLIVLFIPFSILNSSPMNFQVGKILGRILDASSNDPVQSAKVAVYRTKDSGLVSGVISDKDGKFSFDKLAYGNYYLKSTMVGYKPLIIPDIIIENSNEQIDLGDIKQIGSENLTGEAVVTGEKQAVEFQNGKKVFNVDQNITSSGGNALDVLKNVPSVDVDLEGNITLRGSGQVTVLIDGKPANLFGNIQTILSSLPAGKIEKIEVINNPTAKYDAEGQSGIINIILKKQSNLGFNGTLNSSIGLFDNYSSSANLNYRTQSINFFSTIDWNSSRHIRKNNFTNLFYGLDTTQLMKVGHQYWNNHSSGIKLGAEITLDSLDVLTISGNINNSDGTSSNPTFNNNYLFKSNSKELQNLFNLNSNGSGPYNWGEYSLNFKRNLGAKGNDLTFDIYYTPWLFDLNSENTLNYVDINGNPLSNPNNYQVKTRTYGKSSYTHFQTDYTLPLSKESKFEAGAKVVLQGINSHFDYNRFSNETNLYYKDELLSNSANHVDNTYAVYSTYSDKIFGIDFEAGLRAENTMNQLYGMANSTQNFTRSFTDLFPNFAFSYPLSETQSLQMSYSKRINRPNGGQLNPYIDKSDSLNWKSGNPALMPDYTHSYEFSYIFQSDKLTLTTELFYKLTNNLINPRLRQEVAPGVLLEKPYNVGYSENYGLTIFINYDLMKEWKLNYDFSFFQQNAEGSFNTYKFKNNSLGWTAKFINNLSLFDNYFVQLVVSYNSPVVYTQFTRGDYFLANLALKREFLDKKLGITLNWIDVFRSAKLTGSGNGDGFHYDVLNMRDFNLISLNISYKINDVMRMKTQKPDGVNPMGGSNAM